MNVLDYALHLQRDRMVYFERLATEAVSKDLKHLHTLLADGEQSRYDSLMARQRVRHFHDARSSALDGSINAFARLLKMKIAGPYRYDLDGYLHAIKAGEQTIKFYQRTAGREKSPAVAALLQSLADEEKEHLGVIENIYDFVETPKCYLAWREFSNLRGL